MDEDDNGSGLNARAAHACYCTAKYKGSRVWCCPADGRANLEKSNEGEIDPFGIVEGINPTEDDLESAGS